MQQFKSHKTVEAAKIVSLVQDHRASGDAEGYVLNLEGGGIAAIDFAWLHKNSDGGKTNLVGGYFVRYADGYTSWSPAAAFEEGYSPLVHDPKDGALPVSGYKPQNPEAVALVNEFKATEERILRGIDAMAAQPDKYDPYWLHTGMAALQQGFMFLNRSVFKPGRVTLPEDASGAE